MSDINNTSDIEENIEELLVVAEQEEKDTVSEAEENVKEEKIGPQNEIQRFYEHFRNVPLKYIDIFIAVCAVGLVAVVVLGMLKSRGII